MTLVLAYLARNAQLGSGRAAALGLFARIVRVYRLSQQAFAEAQEMRRVMAKRYPHLDI